MPIPQPDEVLSSLKKAAAALRDAGVPFAAGGGLATWARGGPPSAHDVDLLIKEEDRERALEALRAVGMRSEQPPEGWLVKAYDGDVLVDLIHHPSGLEITDEVLARCDELNVNALPMRVLPADDLLASRLMALTEHHLDFGPILEIARSLREQIDWESVRTRTDSSPFAAAFFTMVERLGILPERVA